MSGAEVALVTGASRGVGAALVRELLGRGWRVLGVARGPAAEPERPGRHEHLRLDLSDAAAVERAFDAALAERLGLRAAARVGLVDNAGALFAAPTHEARLADLVRSAVLAACVPTFLYGFVLRHAAPGAAVRIADLSSGAATAPYPGWSAYCQGKAALAMAGRVLAVELEELPALAGRDVRVASYAPGVVDTGMQAEIRAASEAAFPRRARFEALHREGKLAPPEGPARELADFLASGAGPRHVERRYGA